MTIEYERINNRDESKRDFGYKDLILVWFIYSVAMFALLLLPLNLDGIAMLSAALPHDVPVDVGVLLSLPNH